jgi:adenine-specific DNA-methyltransferase
MVVESKLMLEVKAILKSFGDKYFNGDKLKRHKVIEDLNSYDEKLIQSLLNNETINRNFVISVNGKEIFKLNEFIRSLPLLTPPSSSKWGISTATRLDKFF